MNDTGVIVVTFLCKPRQNVTSATPVTSYIQIWLKNLVTVFGNAMQTNVRRKFAHEGTEVWKRENRPFRAFFFLFLEHKRMLTLEINENEVERARLVKEANFPVFLCTAKFNFIKPHLLELC